MSPRKRRPVRRPYVAGRYDGGGYARRCPECEGIGKHTLYCAKAE